MSPGGVCILCTPLPAVTAAARLAGHVCADCAELAPLAAERVRSRARGLHGALAPSSLDELRAAVDRGRDARTRALVYAAAAAVHGGGCVVCGSSAEEHGR